MQPALAIDTPTPSATRNSRFVAGLTLLLGLAYAGTRLPVKPAVLDNLSNFPAHFALAFLACAAVLAFRGRKLFALAAAAAALLPLMQVAPWYFGGEASADPAAGPPVKLLMSNVYYNNRQYDRVQRLIAAENPDVVGLVEVNAEWLRNLGGLRDAYPYHHEVLDGPHLGLGVYSRLPLADVRTLQLSPGGPPAIAATLAAPGGEVELVLVHLPSPVDTANLRHRNGQAYRLGRHVQSLARPAVVAGDFNMTMWNRSYRRLAKAAALTNARAGHGVGPTWPALWRLGVPIDHILATHHVRLENFRVLPAVGSDHLPIAAEFSVRR